jgi:hypothetical protein
MGVEGCRQEGGGEVVLGPGVYFAASVVRGGPGGLEAVATDPELLEDLGVVPEELLPGGVAEVRRPGARASPRPTTELADVPVEGAEERAREVLEEGVMG